MKPAPMKLSLVLGSRRQNVADARAEKRLGSGKLDADKVLKVIVLLRKFGFTNSVIAAIFGVSTNDSSRGIRR
jgi:hypothetical protein